MKRAGFSLIEVVIAAGIAAVCATMAVPAPPPASHIDVSAVQYTGMWGPQFSAALAYPSMTAPLAVPPNIGQHGNEWWWVP
jgi:prepilin-type N-terminal cleavage/methylation domain-containing protein